MPDSPHTEGRRWTLWVCPTCDEHSEGEPGTECEYCCEGIIERLVTVPASTLEAAQQRVEDALVEVERLEQFFAVCGDPDGVTRLLTSDLGGRFRKLRAALRTGGKE